MPPFEELNESNVRLLNEMICIILFTGMLYCILSGCVFASYRHLQQTLFIVGPNFVVFKHTFQ